MAKLTLTQSLSKVAQASKQYTDKKVTTINDTIQDIEEQITNIDNTLETNYITKQELEYAIPSVNTTDDLDLLNVHKLREGSLAFVLEDKLYFSYTSQDGWEELTVGSDSGATSGYISTTDASNFQVETGHDLDLHLDFTSPNAGRGTLKVVINDVDALSTSILQGETTTTISGTLFSKGANTMVVYVIDRTGVMTNSLTFYVRYGSTEIVSDFDVYSAYDYGSVIRYYFTPTALDTSLALTFYMSIDGVTQEGVSCTSDTRGYYTFPSNLSVGAHKCKAWVEDSNGSLSNILVFNLIILDDTSLVVASDTETVTAEEGDQIVLDYKVYMKDNYSFSTKTYIDNILVNTGTCGLTTAYYKTSSLLQGIHTIKIEILDITETVSDYVTWTANITESTYVMKTAITAGSTFIASAVNKTNSDTNKDIWIGTDQDSMQIEVPLVNFSYNDENGWVDDQLLITGNSYVEIPVAPLSENAKYGFTLDIEFLTKPIGIDDALVLDLWDEENNCGIKITTEELIMQSKSGNRCDLYFEENEVISAMFVIDRNEATAKIYLNGVMCEAFHLSDYEANGIDYLEDFTVNKNIKLGGSGYCAIRNIRVYQVALTTNEIINNFIANEIVKSKQKALVQFQKGEDLPTMTIYGDFSGLGKDDKKYCNITYVSPDASKYGESFTLSGKYSQLQYQGTSSMAYPIKNYRINPKNKNGKVKINPFNSGKPESRFTLKADFMTSNHAHNTGMAKFINDKLYNYNDKDEKTMNPMRWYLIKNGEDTKQVRETINGFPCRLILVNDGETTLNEGQAEPTPGNTKDMGIFNFNNDKDNVNTLGLDTEIFPNAMSFEVTANSDTSAGAFVPYKVEPYIYITYQEYSTQDVSINPTAMLPISVIGASAGDTITFEPIDCSRENIHIQWYNNDTYLWMEDGFKSVTIPDTATHIVLQLGTRWAGGVPMETGDTFYLNGVKFVVGEAVETPTYEIKGSTEAEELEYLQNSFELRYPDSDDVGSDYGYLGMAIQKLSIPVSKVNTHMSSKMSIESFGGTRTFTITRDNSIAFAFYSFDATGDTVLDNKPSVSNGSTITVSDNAHYIRFTIKDCSNININGVDYQIPQEYSEEMTNPYGSTVVSQDYGLKRVIDWVGNCTDEEFVADFDKYFNRHYTLRYYLLVVLMAGVDNLG